jgi:glycerol uptake facilitator protein
MQPSLARRMAAEAIGTALLVLFGAGSVVAALTVGKGQLDYGGLGFIALSFAIVIAAVVYAFGPVSGAHINPAVSFGLAATGRFSWVDLVPYVVAQLVGGAVGGLLIVAAFGTGAVDLGSLGATTLGSGVNYGHGIVAEALGTYILVFTIMGLAVDSRAPKGWAGLIIGLSVACSIVVIGPLTGSSLNPARTFGPYFASQVFGGDVPWSQFALYWIGPFLGALAAVLTYDLVAQPRLVEVVVDVPSSQEVRIEDRVEA